MWGAVREEPSGRKRVQGGNQWVELIQSGGNMSSCEFKTPTLIEQAFQVCTIMHYCALSKMHHLSRAGRSFNHASSIFMINTEENRFLVPNKSALLIMPPPPPAGKAAVLRLCTSQLFGEITCPPNLLSSKEEEEIHAWHKISKDFGGENVLYLSRNEAHYGIQRNRKQEYHNSNLIQIKRFEVATRPLSGDVPGMCGYLMNATPTPNFSRPLFEEAITGDICRIQGLS